MSQGLAIPLTRSLYHFGFSVGGGTPSLQLKTNSTVQAYVTSIRFSNWVSFGGASTGFIRSATLGTATTSKNGVAGDPNAPASSSVVCTAWSVNPTISGTPVYIHQTTYLPTAISWNLDFPVDAPFIIPVSSSLLLWTLSGTPQVDGIISWYEQ